MKISEYSRLDSPSSLLFNIDLLHRCIYSHGDCFPGESYLKTALVIHPRFYVYGGGELLSLHVMKLLQDEGYHVILASDTYDPETVERIYRLGDVMQNVEHIPLVTFKGVAPRFLALQRTFYARKVKTYLSSYKPDVVFSTQSSLYNITSAPLYHFIYDIVDLFAYPEPLLAGVDPPLGGRGLHWRMYYQALKWIRARVMGRQPTPRLFFALSSHILSDLIRNGYRNSQLIYPPCPMEFLPGEKKNRIIQVTRIVPQKRLEWFLQIAEALPEYNFMIVGRDTPILRQLNPGYSKKLLSNLPENVTYTETAIRNRPELLQEAKAYLYTGVEPGIGIALVEGIGAGCIPIAPVQGGGAEVIKASGIGYEYNTVDEAIVQVKNAMRSEINPMTVRDHAKIFSPEAFEEQMRKLLP